jgi:hypothetical protein
MPLQNIPHGGGIPPSTLLATDAARIEVLSNLDEGTTLLALPDNLGYRSSLLFHLHQPHLGLYETERHR